MNVWNRQIYMILMMAFYQLIYDPAIVLANVPLAYQNISIVNANSVFAIVGGIGASIVSNIIIGQVFSIIFLRRLLKVKHFMLIISIMAGLPSIAVAIAFFVAQANNNVARLQQAQALYYYIRATSIGINIVLYISILYLVRVMFENIKVVATFDKAILEFVRYKNCWKFCPF